MFSNTHQVATMPLCPMPFGTYPCSDFGEKTGSEETSSPFSTSCETRRRAFLRDLSIECEQTDKLHLQHDRSMNPSIMPPLVASEMTTRPRLALLDGLDFVSRDGTTDMPDRE